MARRLSPLEAAARLGGRPGRVLLHSAADADGCGQYSFAACEPRAEVIARGREVEVRLEGRVQRFTGDALAVVEELALAAGAASPPAGDRPEPLAIGYLSYDLDTGSGPRPAVRGPRPPDLWFGFYDAVWRHTHASGASEVIGRAGEACRRLEEALARPLPPGPAPRLGPLAADPELERAYQRGFDRVLAYLAAGDVYQVNLARRLSASLETDGDALTLHARVAARSPAPYGALLETGDVRVISASPERFLYRSALGGRVETRPIKGTRRRTGDPCRDRAAAAELARDAKEQAEHLMIVDLERNDLGRVAVTGSVRVDSFARVVELPTLFHLVSTVSCQLRPSVGFAELIRATFPGGSITGAPKRRAIEIIAELEPGARGLYTGAIGYLGRGGALDLSIAIRTATLGSGALELGVGGGIVADSLFPRELEETEEKAAAWRDALGPGVSVG